MSDSSTDFPPRSPHRLPVASRASRGWRVSRAIAWLLAAVAVALGAWSVFPDLVLVFNDDFGYVRSIVHTLERGRPWTDDWLEPWAASLSGISALVFQLTGSFRLATQGVQIVALVATWWLATRWLRERGVGRVIAAVAAVLGLTFPTLLFKSIEFGSMVVSVPCLFACGWCAARGRWGWFFVAWLVAVSTRQSAAAWLALPAWVAWREWRGRSSSASSSAAHGEWRGPAIVVGLGIVAYLAIHATMNETYAQRTLTRGMLGQWEAATAARHLGWAAGVFVVAAGLSAFVQGATASSGSRSLLAPRGFRFLQFGALLGVLVFVALDPRGYVAWEHNLCQGDRGRAYLGLLGLLAAIGWWRGGFRLRGEWVSVALAATALVCLRRMVWDYYFTDVALAAALGTMRASAALPADARAPAGAEAPTFARPWLAPFRWVALLAALAIAWWHAGFVRELKNQLVGQAVIVALSENALRAGRISPAQLSLGPFGYQGWHWYPHFVKQDGPRGEFIANFLGYVAGNGLELSSSAPGAPPWRYGEVTVAPASPAPEGGGATAGRELASGVFRWEWRVPVRFALRLPAGAETPPAKTVDASRAPYEPQRFPLNDAEWREWIAARRGR